MATFRDVVLLKDNTDRLGRKYSHVDLYNEITPKKVILGELGMGIGDKISLDKVSHQIINVRVGTDSVVGDVEILNTPCGKLANELINNNIPWRTGLRSIGVLNEDNTVTEFKFITFDLVFDREINNG